MSTVLPNDDMPLEGLREACPLVVTEAECERVGLRYVTADYLANGYLSNRPPRRVDDLIHEPVIPADKNYLLQPGHEAELEAFIISAYQEMLSAPVEEGMYVV